MTYRQSAEHAPNPVMVDFDMLFVRHIWTIIEKKVFAVASHAGGFNADAKVASKEIFHIEAAAPGMIFREESIILAVVIEVPKGTIVGQLFVDATHVGPDPRVGAPHADVELRISVVLFARNRSNLLHLLAGILLCPGLTKCAHSAQNCYG